MENRETVVRKVRAFVEGTYGDASVESFKKAFALCDANKDGKCSLDEIRVLLGLANVGYQFTRSAIAKAILDELDINGDDLVEWEEFHKVFAAE